MGLKKAMPEIHLPVFDGPLDLLLGLIEKNDLDITTVSLAAVADQYLKAVREGDRTDPGALADYLAIGSRLVLLKSRALLPRPPAAALEDLDEGDPGQELVDMLLEYRRFSSVVAVLKEREDAGLRTFTRQAAPPPRQVDEGPGLDGVTVDLMRKIMLDVLSRTPPPPRPLLQRDRATLSQSLANLRQRLQRDGRFSFRQVMESCKTRLEVVLAFLAILELLKAGECDAEQDERYGDINVVALAAEPVGASLA